MADLGELDGFCGELALWPPNVLADVISSER
jgi:hypothetical protein